MEFAVLCCGGLFRVSSGGNGNGNGNGNGGVLTGHGISRLSAWMIIPFLLGHFYGAITEQKSNKANDDA
jgi:hypothetical protein